MNAPVAHGETLDDLSVSFSTVGARTAGRIVRLGAVADEILRKHAYPEPVSRALGHALALTALLGATLRPDSKLILQTRTDGPLGMLVVNYETPGMLRGYASFDETRLAEMTGPPGEGQLLGSGHLAMTIDPGGEAKRYQGIVALEGDSLSMAAHTYFRQSEQLPSYIRLAVARHRFGPGQGGDGGWHWRAGGLIVQHLPALAGAEDPALADEAEGGDGLEDWNRVRLLAATLEDHELIDPILAPEQLLYRLFHEEGVRALPRQPLSFRCGCSRQRVTDFLTRFGRSGLEDMREADGGVNVTCEFCSTSYRYARDEIDAM